MRFGGNVRFFGNSILFNSYHRLRQILKGNIRTVHIQIGRGITTHSISDMVEYFYFKDSFYKKSTSIPTSSLCRKNNSSFAIVRNSISQHIFITLSIIV